MSGRYLAWDSITLNRAAEHGCLDENVETGDPTACASCVAYPPAERNHKDEHEHMAKVELLRRCPICDLRFPPGAPS